MEAVCERGRANASINVSPVAWLKGLWYRLTARRLGREIEDELTFHLHMRTEEYLETGISSSEARSRAMRRLGNLQSVIDECHAVYGLHAQPSPVRTSLEFLMQDLRYALRSLWRQPGFSLLAIATLAVAMGSNTLVFSAVNRTLLHPVPFEGGERWVYLWNTSPSGNMSIAPDPAAVHAWRERAHSLEAIATYGSEEFVIRLGDEPRQMRVASASAELLPFLNVQPLLGRRFVPADTIDGADRVALLAQRFWNSHFGRDPHIVGQTIRLNDASYTVIGVLPSLANAFFARDALADPASLDYAVWVPGANLEPTVARLRPGVNTRDVLAEVSAIHAQLEFSSHRPAGWSPTIRRPVDNVATDLRVGLWVLMGAVGFVLLVACVNVANMLLARGVSRGHELAVRTALGATRARIVRQLMLESFLLTATATALAVGLASQILSLLQSRLPAGLEALHGVGLAGTVVGVGAAIALLTGVVFGLVPVGQVRMLNLTGLLSHGHRSGVGTPKRASVRSGLVAVEVALATVLFIGAGLLVNSLRRLEQHDPGFNPENVLTFSVALPDTRYPDAPSRTTMFQSLLERIRGISAVRSAAIGTIGTSGATEGSAVVEGNPEPHPSRLLLINLVSDQFFETMAMTLPQGRDFSTPEISGDERRVVVNENLARTYWPDETAVGKRFRFANSELWYTVVGVARNVALSGLRADRRDLQIYQPYPSWGITTRDIVVRANGDPRDIIPLLKGAVWTLDPGLPVREIKIASDILKDAIARPRFNALLLSGFAVTALMLAAIGVYGVVALALQHRTPELGVRVALGATKRDIVGLMVGYGLRPVAIGAVVGVLGALALSRFLGSLLFEIQPTDPMTYTLVTAVLVMTALAACYLPARRALALDPVEVLRQQ